MKPILIVITETVNPTNIKAFRFYDRDSATEFLKETYTNIIREIELYDYENSYITKEFDFAQVSSGINTYRIFLCDNITEVSKTQK